MDFMELTGTNRYHGYLSNLCQAVNSVQFCTMLLHKHLKIFFCHNIYNDMYIENMINYKMYALLVIFCNFPVILLVLIIAVQKYIWITLTDAMNDLPCTSK